MKTPGSRVFVGLLSLVLITLSSCSQQAESLSQLAVAQVESGQFNITVRAEGELVAESSIPLTLPPGNMMPRTIVWLAEDGQWVEKGEVIARFDLNMATRGLDKILIALKKSDLDIEAKNREFELALQKITADLVVTEQELGVAERFGVEEGSIAMSRQEMIERLQDEGFLRIKQDHYQKRQGGQRSQREAELAVLGAQRNSEANQGAIFQQQIDASAVVAPNAGYFIIRRNWFGEPMSAGQSVFPGNAFAEIPNLEKMQAQLQVLESEAGGIAIGQAVEVVTDAYPDRPLNGTISGISQIPASLERDSPIKYFTVNVDLEQTDSSWITPGIRVRAEIQILRKNNTLTIPNQAIERGQNGSDARTWVYMKDGSSIEKRYIEVGERGPVRTEIIAGLDAEDEVLLVRPNSNKPGAGA